MATRNAQVAVGAKDIGLDYGYPYVSGMNVFLYVWHQNNNRIDAGVKAISMAGTVSVAITLWSVQAVNSSGETLTLIGASPYDTLSVLVGTTANYQVGAATVASGRLVKAQFTCTGASFPNVFVPWLNSART